MKTYSTAKHYAKALFFLVRDKDAPALDTVSSILQDFSTVCEENVLLEEGLTSPAVTEEEKRALLHTVYEKVARTGVYGTITEDTLLLVERFFLLLVTMRRIPLLSVIYEIFLQYCDEYKGVVRVTIETASACPNEDREKLASFFTKNNKNVLLEYTMNEALLGGFAIRIQDFRLDASLRTQFEILKDTIIRGVHNAH